jgi:hypothetical protein
VAASSRLGGDGECAHNGGAPGRAHHADGLCAAAGTGSAYSPPALVGAAPAAAAASPPAGAAPRAPRTGRAPPDLSELQLLRI